MIRIADQISVEIEARSGSRNFSWSLVIYSLQRSSDIASGVNTL